MKILTDTGLMVLWNKIKQLVLGNRPYNPSEFSGKGYKVLEKNIQTVGGVKKNILTAIMLSEANTIYEIRYDFDLNGETIEMQEGCTLKFCGGSLKNGVLTLAQTSIKCSPYHIFSNVVLQGSIVGNIILNWFEKSSDCTSSRKNLDCAIHVVGDCVIDEPLLVESSFDIYGDSMYDSRISLSKDYTKGVRTIFLFTSEATHIFYIKFKDFTVQDTDYVFYRDVGGTIANTAVSQSDFSNIYVLRVKRAIFSIRCSGWGNSNFYNIFARCGHDGTTPAFNFVLNWFNDNCIRNCRINITTCKGVLNIDCNNENKTEISRNTIKNCWIEGCTLQNSEDLIEIKSSGTLRSLFFSENYLERNFKQDNSEIGIFKFQMPVGDHIIKQLVFSNNVIVSKYRYLLSTETRIAGLDISNNSFTSDTKLSLNDAKLQNFVKYNNDGNINVETTNSVVEIYNLNDDRLDKYSNTQVNEFIQAGESLNIRLVPESFKSVVYCSDVLIYTNNSTMITGKIMSNNGTYFKFIQTYSSGDDISIQEFKSTGVMVLKNNTNSRVEVFAGSLLIRF